jgi:alkanesulfonate monooxygenase SsuD/methylene tetrahydromethanopterin reductase-like flavin-dependent oxidoreductase (luciferase family)
VTAPRPDGAFIPRPVQSRVPLLTGPNSDRVLRLTAERADIAAQPSVDAFTPVTERLRTESA